MTWHPENVPDGYLDILACHFLDTIHEAVSHGCAKGPFARCSVGVDGYAAPRDPMLQLSFISILFFASPAQGFLTKYAAPPLEQMEDKEEEEDNNPLAQLSSSDLLPEEVALVRTQEKRRFEKPWEYFRYELSCKGERYSVVVPPLKGYTRPVRRTCVGTRMAVG